MSLFASSPKKSHAEATRALFESLETAYENVSDAVNEVAGSISAFQDSALRTAMYEFAVKEIQFIVEKELEPVIKGTRLSVNQDKADSEYKKMVTAMTTAAFLEMRKKVDAEHAAPVPIGPDPATATLAVAAAASPELVAPAPPAATSPLVAAAAASSASPAAASEPAPETAAP